MKKKPPPIVNLAVAAIEEVKGLDLKVLDVHALTTITDYMVVCTGTSNRHVKSIAENVIARAKESGHRPRGVEGLNSGEWALVDLADVVVHVMQVQARLFYQLEKLWDLPPAEAEQKIVGKPARKPKARAKTRAKAKTRVKSRTGTRTKAKKRR
jgi:ribosome-associated protein